MKCLVCQTPVRDDLLCAACIRAFKKNAEGAGIPGAVKWAAGRVRRSMARHLAEVTARAASWENLAVGYLKRAHEAEEKTQKLQKALESIREAIWEEKDCDCPPEWPRCLLCRIQQIAGVAIRETEKKEKKP